MKCPCCGGSGEIEEKSPVDLPGLQFRIWDIVRKSRHGISGPALIERAYSHRSDGGPLTANIAIRVSILRANKKLAKAGQRIVHSNRNNGGVYRLERTV